MMKKSLLAVAVAGALAAPAMAQVAGSTGVTLYGIAGISINSTSNGLDSSSVSKDFSTATGVDLAKKDNSSLNLGGASISSSRIGVKGTEDLGNGLAGNFVIETAVALDTPVATNAIGGRAAWVGLSGGFGAVSFGRQYAPILSVAGGSDIDGISDATSNYTNTHGNGANVRQNNSIVYTSPNFSGVEAKVAYYLGEKTSGTDNFDTHSNGGAGLSVTYANGPLWVGLGYNAAETVTFTAASKGGDKAAIGDAGTAAATASSLKATVSAVRLGASYDLGAAKINAGYLSQSTKNSTTTSVTAAAAGELTAAAFAAANGDTAAVDTTYKLSMFNLGITAPLSANAKVVAQVAMFDGDSDDAKSKATGFTLGADYNLSKRTTTYARFSTVKWDYKDAETASVLSLNVQHSF